MTNKHSTTGFVNAINGSPIAHRSKRQTVTILSSFEAEYVALTAFAKKLTWIRKLRIENIQEQSWQ